VIDSSWITRDELIARLEARGLTVEPRTLQYWEYTGQLARPIRKWDVRVRAPRAFYTQEAFEAVQRLVELKAGKPCPYCGATSRNTHLTRKYLKGDA
jgi:hypothetical protein